MRPASPRLASLENGGGAIVPVDSEHSALYQCLEGRSRESVHRYPDRLGRPVSRAAPRGTRRRDGGPGARPSDLVDGTKDHSGQCNAANKGLELIEAHWLFSVPYERIEVVVHPDSIVHAFVRFRDGAALAHAGYPDMRVPISMP